MYKLWSDYGYHVFFIMDLNSIVHYHRRMKRMNDEFLGPSVRKRLVCMNL